MMEMEETQAKPARGRPRGFCEEQALDKALHLFWQRGYESTSLDDLTDAMGISRSSFYGCFGTKHALLLRALRQYAERGIAGLRQIRDASPDPQSALRAMLAAVADVDGGQRGCMMTNCITELAPHDMEVAEIAQVHIREVEDLFEQALRDAGMATGAACRARSLVSLGLGAVTLRKAGLPADTVRGALDAAERLLPEDGEKLPGRAGWLGSVFGGRTG